MLRRRGYALRGKKVAIRGDFVRKPRVSILAFIGLNGMIDYYNTEGTLDRVEFTKCCQAFVQSPYGSVRQYPGSNSVWILDGAAIHCHPEIIHYSRSVEVVPIFLPAYCPFFNPIEFLFGYVKRSFQRHYAESSGRNLLPFIVQTFRRFTNFNMRNVFEHCGWRVQCIFDPSGPLSNENQQVPERNVDRWVRDDLDFTAW
ncbi:Serine/threonine-protein kinase [Phytophthora megakarya]|uniref:Serine/threonine-protein kinase n=1 Tax=Phytophthora megakarya TaxID=4795 RepID=A0A225V548_9STRA|nr:Serine/threonine-protein kinase [Phytophthora megakarya]